MKRSNSSTSRQSKRRGGQTNPTDFGIEKRRLRLALTGFGLHKAELGGGANPDTIFAKVLRAVHNFVYQSHP